MTLGSEVQNSCKRLGAILLGEKVITEGQLAEALKKRETEGGFLGKVLVELGYISEPVLVNFLVKQFKIPHINLMDYEVSEELVKSVPKEICLKYSLLPIDRLGKILTLAMVDPLDMEALQKVKEVVPELRIKPILCSWNHFEHVIRRIFPRNPGAEDEEVSSAESFGLPPAPSKPARKPVVAVAPPPIEVVEVVPVAVVAEAIPGGTPAAARGGGSSSFLEAVEGSVREAVQRAVDSVGDRVQEMVASANGSRSATGLELVDTIRQAMGDAMEEATGTLLFKTQQALEQATVKASDLTVEQMAEVLRTSMRQAIQDASADLVRQAAGNLGESQNAP